LRWIEHHVLAVRFGGDAVADEQVPDRQHRDLQQLRQPGMEAVAADPFVDERRPVALDHPSAH
jgi:hypothetical protein